jgi:hypothetical protein
MIVTHELHACMPTSSFVIKNIDLVWILERNMIFSHVINNTKIFHHKRMIMFELHRERQNEIIYYKLMSNAHYCPLQFNDISLKEIFSIQSSFHFANHDPLMPCCDYNHDENFVFSNEIIQTSNTYQSSFYDPIYDCLEESFLKKFPCHYFSFVSYYTHRDRIKSWLEESYNRKFPLNKHLLIGYIPHLLRCSLRFSCCFVFTLNLLILVVQFYAKLKQLDWLHWKHDYT